MKHIFATVSGKDYRIRFDYPVYPVIEIREGEEWEPASLSEERKVTMALGENWSRSKKWKRQYNWASRWTPADTIATVDVAEAEEEDLENWEDLW